MSKMVLVHGSCHAGWAWEKVIPALAGLGTDARAIDLPGRGGVTTTLHAQARAILAALDGPSVLVGHSAGGYPVTLAAELADPGQVLGVIYLCAYVPRPGMSVADLRRAGPAQPLRHALRLSQDKQSYSFDPAACADLFYHDCPDPQAAIARLCLEPIAPQETALPAMARAMALPRAAILCQNDRAIPPKWQTEIAANLPTITLPSGHSPFFSMPQTLANALHHLSAQLH